MKFIPTLLSAGFAWLAASSAQAHLGYGARDFGIFQADGTDLSVTKNGSATGNFGWADGADGIFGDSHKLNAFRFTLLRPGTVTLDVRGTTENFLPGFSIYSGLAHLAPDKLDHDGSEITQLYLLGLGAPAQTFAFNALDTWKIGNEDRVEGAVTIPASLSTFTYLGHAADGTAENYGASSGIHGDGVADNFVRGTFQLPAGDYSIFVGGGQIAGKQDLPYQQFSYSAKLTVVPEPSGGVLGGLAALVLFARRRRGTVATRRCNLRGNGCSMEGDVHGLYRHPQSSL